MSVLLNNAKANFVQPEKADGRFHLVIEAELVGHSELQDRLIRKIFERGERAVEDVEVIPATAGSHSSFKLSISAPEAEISEAIAAENENREVQKGLLDRSYTDQAADEIFSKTKEDEREQEVKNFIQKETPASGPASESAPVSGSGEPQPITTSAPASDDKSEPGSSDPETAA